MITQARSRDEAYTTYHNGDEKDLSRDELPSLRRDTSRAVYIHETTWQIMAFSMKIRKENYFGDQFPSSNNTAVEFVFMCFVQYESTLK